MANSSTTPRRRSARLGNKQAPSPRSNARKTPLYNAQLGSLLERDETPEAGEHSSIDKVISTPATESALSEKILQLTSIKTPTTQPHPSCASMHPEMIHQTTSKKPDSGLRLGFGDISARKSLAHTPSKVEPRQSLPQTLISPTFEFQFASHNKLSNEAQTLMENVREEAARIKAQMQAEQHAQHNRDEEAGESLAGIVATGRKIAQPKGKAGRFSDIHMAQFKKMDSIANHASSFRAKAGSSQPPRQSLKRSGSKADLYEIERPRTAGKGTPGRPPPPFAAPTASVGPFKSTLSKLPSSDRLENASPAKRMRQSEFQDVSSHRRQETDSQKCVKPSALPQPVLASLWSPTKASQARAAATKSSTGKEGVSLQRSSSTQSLRSAFESIRPAPDLQKPLPATSPSKLPRSDSSKSLRPLPPIPKRSNESSQSTIPRSSSTKTLTPAPKTSGLASRLPNFSGLKSILRSSRPASSRKATVTAKEDTPKRPNTANATIDSAKKVDFTPSVKSRYAVKLAAQSPTPAKLLRTVDPAEFDTENEEEDHNWEDVAGEVEYPTLPGMSPGQGPVVQTFSAKAKEHNRRESKEFKSIFTTLPRPVEPATLTSVKTIVNKTDPTKHVNTTMRSPGDPRTSKNSPSTIRHVRNSDIAGLVQPFEDTIQGVAHGLPEKKRRHDSAIQNDEIGVHDDDKENCRISVIPKVSGAWEDSVDDEDEGERRATKRVRTSKSQQPPAKKEDTKKPSAAREAAAKNAKDRKGKGMLSLARLNMLSRPKQRG